MRNGRIAYFEDHPGLVVSLGFGVDVFSEGRHEVVASAVNLSGALAVLDQIATGEIDANVVLSDGNLASGTGGHDARKIMDRILTLGLGVRTVLLSTESADDIGVQVDAGMLKTGFKIARLTDVLDELPEID